MDYSTEIKPPKIGEEVSYEEPSFQTPYQEGRAKPQIAYKTGLLGKPKFVLQTIDTSTGNTFTFYAPTEKPE